MPEAIAKELEPAVLIADAFALRRAGIMSLLREWAEMHTVSLWSSDLPDSAGIEDGLPTCCLCVVNLGSLSVNDSLALAWLSRMRDRFPDTPLVILSDRTEPSEAFYALKQGACGYVPTTTAPEVAMQALSFIMSGGTFFPPEALTTGPPSQSRGSGPVSKRRSDPDRGPNGHDHGDVTPLCDGEIEEQARFAIVRSVVWIDFGPRSPFRAPDVDPADIGPTTGTVLAFRPRNRENG